MKALIVLSEKIVDQEYLLSSVENLAMELQKKGITPTVFYNFDDGLAYIQSNEPVDCLLYGRKMSDKEEKKQSAVLVNELHARQVNAPVFLLSSREEALITFNRNLMEQVDEFAWVLEDAADFIAGRIHAAIKRYRDQLLPPLMNGILQYNETHGYSWAAPGHQGGVGFTKTPAGRVFHDFYGENLFRTDMGIERTSLGSLLDHTGFFADCEKNIARIFGSDVSYSVVAGTSGSNRSVMQACISDNDIVIVDRNCHKSIEQGLILTGARPVYMIPSRNHYGIIGPIFPTEMSIEAVNKKMAKNPLISNKEKKKPVYSVVTNCTYDGVCYNAKKAQDYLDKLTDRIHFDEAWYGYARFNPLYHDHFAMRDETRKKNPPTVFATQSSHKLLNALSQASYIHIRNGRKSIDFDRFNQAYMMHTTTSPLYAICASNDIAADMMDGNRGLSLTNEVIRESIDFRQAIAKLYKEFKSHDDWFFKPWNKEIIRNDSTDEVYNFEEAPVSLLMNQQSCWTIDPNEKWHGFKGLTENWAMIDPIKVSILAPGLDEEGQFLDKGVPAALITKWLYLHGIVPTRTTDFQIMFLFSMGVTKGKWGTLATTLLTFKRHYDANTPLKLVYPDLVKDYPKQYADKGLQELGDIMFKFLKENAPVEKQNLAFAGLPDVVMTPRDAYQQIVKNNVELVPIEKLANRTVATSVIPYPPGIPMIMSGEKFGAIDSAQIAYLRCLQKWDKAFPGFEHDTEGAVNVKGSYHVLCVKK